jgi:hypothetical protein
LQQAKEYLLSEINLNRYEGMTDGLNLVVTTKGNTSELAEYYRSRVIFFLSLGENVIGNFDGI